MAVGCGDISTGITDRLDVSLLVLLKSLTHLSHLTLHRTVNSQGSMKLRIRMATRNESEESRRHCFFCLGGIHRRMTTREMFHSSDSTSVTDCFVLLQMAQASHVE